MRIGPLLFFLAAGVGLFRFILGANLPLVFRPWAPHDDGLFMSLAQHLRAGQWLGPFSQFTLMKGPGYPIFLALSSFSGLPVTAAHSLFQVIAVGLSCAAIGYLTGRRGLATIAFVLLALHPAGLLSQLQAVIREQIYWPLTLLVFALFSVILLKRDMAQSRGIAMAIVAGIVLAWAWLTREEGAWFLPGLFVLLAGGAIDTWRNWPATKSLLIRLVVAGVAFAAVNLAFVTENDLAYGSFVGVDFKEHNFVAALDALQSVEAGPIIPYLPMPLAARNAAAVVSPTFAPLATMLAPGGQQFGWSGAGCPLYPATCGDIAGGWFMWGLRGSAQIAGYYKTPATAADAFARIAAEIEAACSSGRLTCRRGLIPFLPALTAGQWGQLPRSLLEVVRRIELDDPIGVAQSIGAASDPLVGADALAKWQLLNYPRLAPMDASKAPWHASGWYYSPHAAQWPTLTVSAASGSLLPATVQRTPSADLVAHFSDPAAAWSRFRVDFSCPDKCILSAGGAANPPMQLPLEPGQAPTAEVGANVLHIDSVTVEQHTDLGHSSWPTEKIRTALFALYHQVLSILIPLGLASFALAVVLAIIGRRANPLLFLAAAAWTLVATRMVLLGLIDISSFPGVGYGYASPAVYLAALAATLSVGALLPAGKEPVTPLSAKSG